MLCKSINTPKHFVLLFQTTKCNVFYWDLWHVHFSLPLNGFAELSFAEIKAANVVYISTVFAHPEIEIVVRLEKYNSLSNDRELYFFISLLVVKHVGLIFKLHGITLCFSS